MDTNTRMDDIAMEEYIEELEKTVADQKTTLEQKNNELERMTQLAQLFERQVQAKNAVLAEIAARMVALNMHNALILNQSQE